MSALLSCPKCGCRVALSLVEVVDESSSSVRQQLEREQVERTNDGLRLASILGVDPNYTSWPWLLDEVERIVAINRLEREGVRVSTALKHNLPDPPPVHQHQEARLDGL